MEVKHLNVKIGADKTGYESAMKGVSASLQKHKAQFRKVGMAMTVAGGAIVGALGLMVKGYVQAGDEVHKMAQRTGFATETLSELRYAAEISGADITALEKGIKKMSKTIVDAGDGLTTYVRAFERIGIEVKDLESLNPEEQFMKIGNAIASVEDPTIRTASAMDIFGRAGTQLLPLFNQGVDGMEELRQKARELGIVFDQEAANKAARLADAQVTLKASMQGVSRSIAETFVPILSDLAEKAAKVISKITDWVKENPKLAGTIVKIVAGLGALMLVLGPLAVILPSLVAGVGLLAGAFVGIIAPIGLVVTAVGVAATTFLKLKSAQDEARKAGERYEENVKKLKNKLNETRKAVGMNNTEWSKLIKKYKENYAAMAMAIRKGKEGKEMQKALAEASKESKKAYDEQRGATEELTGATEGLTKEAGNLIEKLEYVAPASMELAQQFVNGKISILDYTTGMRNLRLEAEKIADPYAHLELALDSSVEGFEDWGESTEGVMGSVLESVGLWNQDSQAAYDENAAAAEESARAAQAAWEESHRHLLNFVTNVGGVIGQLVQDFKFSWEGVKDFFGGIWSGVLGSFKAMIGDMATEWATTFLKNTLLNLTSGAVTEAAGTITTGIGSAIKSVTTTATKLATSFSPAGVIGSALTGAISGLISGLISGGKATTQIRILRDIRWWLETIQHHIEVGTNQALYAIKDQALGGFYPKFDAMLEQFYQIKDATKGTLAALTSQGTVYVDVFRSGIFESVGIGITDSIGKMSGDIGGAINDMGDNIGGAVHDVAGRIGDLDFDTGGIIDAVDRMRGKFGGINGEIPTLQEGGIIKRDTLARLHAGEEVIPPGGGRSIVFAPQYGGIYDRRQIQDLTEREIFPRFKRILHTNKRGERVQFNRAQRKY